MHRCLDARASGVGGKQQHRCPVRCHAGSHGQHPDRGAERRRYPRGLCQNAGGFLYLPGERGRAGHRGHPLYRCARHLPLGPLHPHCGAAGLAERLHRRQLPPGQRRDAGGSLHRRAQADGLQDDRAERLLPQCPAQQGQRDRPAHQPGAQAGRGHELRGLCRPAVQRPDGQHGLRQRLRHEPGLHRLQRAGGWLHRADEQPAGPLCGWGRHPAALCPGGRLPQR